MFASMAARGGGSVVTGIGTRTAQSACGSVALFLAYDIETAPRNCHYPTGTEAVNRSSHYGRYSTLNSGPENAGTGSGRSFYPQLPPLTT